MFEFLITVAVLVVIAFPVIAIIALIRSIELSRLVSDLNARLRALEHALPSGGAPRAPVAAPRAAPPPMAAARRRRPRKSRHRRLLTARRSQLRLPPLPCRHPLRYLRRGCPPLP